MVEKETIREGATAGDSAAPEKIAASAKTSWSEKLAQRLDGTAKSALTKKETNSVALFLVGLAVVFSGASLALSVYNYYHGGTNTTTYVSSGTDGNSANFTEGSIAEVAAKVSPAVVSITTETRTTSYYGQSSTSTAAGTGMIVSEDGYVITNKHVTEDATAIAVVLDDGTTYENVELAAEDPLNDVAYLKIAGVSGLPTVTLGDSKTVSVGQQVITIGNALGQYQNTVASGIVSGTGRSVIASDSSSNYYETLTDMIQTDAAINAGNSGGPLVNAAGEVIGINTATSDANSIGFAIPISSVKGMLKAVVANGTAERAYIGVSYVSLTPSVAQEYGVSVDYGAYVAEDGVVSGSPAAEAGIKSGDVITAVNGVAIGSSGSLSSLIGEYSVGETVSLTILRDGQELTANVTLAAYQAETSSSSSSSNSDSYRRLLEYMEKYLGF